MSLTTREGNVVLSTVTDDLGNFQFAAVEPGNYKLKAEMPGFQSFDKPITVPEGVSVLHQIRLELAGVAQSVQVTAENQQLSTNDALVGGVVAQQAIEAVP